MNSSQSDITLHNYFIHLLLVLGVHCVLEATCIPDTAQTKFQIRLPVSTFRLWHQGYLCPMLGRGRLCICTSLRTSGSYTDINLIKVWQEERHRLGRGTAASTTQEPRAAGRASPWSEHCASTFRFLNQCEHRGPEQIHHINYSPA